ncbi:glycerol-3-phosphate 1-O-acyltransferase PlsY [Ignatzschineria rhizosphaerae]|uniref:Glycerol-3-phosphate acyltransferase n=1 Tax=Ignatzschineria rhizosphaerae TaxID=2923279 RepID=A0ABY3X3W8_9GAMM|nr:glycerol-3-phosphate 1-O-acyltransferase PlsY [Ignatzschineria rhizosphaerae]UNM96456.1 glycerol-3-phosphate 1-O-acyltransferase PlsY [Ignatzschineria rhizosphaerae]
MDITLFGYLLIGGSYLIGSLSSAIILCKLAGLPDPRTEGSGNPGATNVMRIGGKKLAALTLLGDLLKGLIPVILAWLLNQSPLTVSLVAIAAFIGHLFPIFFGFKGGKGVATALGAILGLNYLVALCALGVWIIIFAITKISSLSALIAAVSAPIFLYLFNASSEIVWAVIFMDLLLIYRHKSNIQRLLKGEEGKLKSKK